MNNYDSVKSQLAGFGLIVDRLEVGRMQRCKVEGDRENRGWYALHEIANNQGERILVGSYGVWRGADNNAQKITVERNAISAEQAAALKQRIAADRKQADAKRQRAAENAANKAGLAWRKYLPGEGVSDYLQRKGVPAYGVRWAPSGNGTFAIPMCDAAGKVWGLQIIRGKNRGPGKLEKEYFPRGLAKKGHYHTLGVVRDVVLLCEGYATGATLHHATGLPVVVAFDAGNLMPVAEALRKANKSVQIIVCADDDYLTDGNPGVTAATNAAMAVGGIWCKPVFAADRAGAKITDFNDLAALEGEQAVVAQITAVVDNLPQTARPPSLARGALPKGGGDDARDAMPSMLTVDEAVARWWGTYGLGGKALFDEVERRLVHRDDVMNLLTDHAWRDVRKHPDWRVARDTEIGFDPTEKDPAIRCNLFGGWPTTPKAGTCTRLLELLEYLCMNEANASEIYQWILKWLAYPIQHRGAKMHSAIVVHGGQGTGKSRFFEAYARIFGPYGRVLGQEALEDKFNADWAEKKLFILADEVLARQDMYHIKNRLKGFITGDTIRVNPKNVAAHNEKNQMNIVFLSNERQPLALENDDRRHLVIWVPPKLPDLFFAEVNAEIDAGGVDALHHYLLELDLGDFKPWTKPPMTRAKEDLVELGRSSEERFLREWISLELESPGGELLPFCPCLGSQLYKAYEGWCDRHGERKRGMKDLVSLAGKLPGWSAGTSHPTWATLHDRTSKNRKLIVPSDPDMQASQRQCRTGAQAKLQREHYASKAEWLTACFFEFEQAMGLSA